MIINYKNKKIEIPVREVSGFGFLRGLMFRQKKRAFPLLFDFKKPVKLKIHSLFVFFDFFVLWLDDKNSVLEKRLVRPWKISVRPAKKFSKFIEIPLNIQGKSYMKSLVED